MQKTKTLQKKAPSAPSAPSAQTAQTIQIEKELVKDLKTLTRSVENLRDLEFIQVFKRPWKFMWMSFLKGLMVGFGSVLGATVIVALFVYILSQISLVPVVGDFVKEVIDEIQVPTGK